MQEEAFQYHVLIIRLWQETATGPERYWRFALSQSATNERHGFTNRQALLTQLALILGEIVGNEQQPTQPEALRSPYTDAEQE